MELREICKSKPFFKLQSTGRRKHFLRPLNLRDELWIDETYDKNFPNLSEDMEALARVVYHQIEDKKPFVKQNVNFIDEDGIEEKKEIGGVELFKQLIGGTEEKLNILEAWLKVLGVSRKQQDEIVKKKIMTI